MHEQQTLTKTFLHVDR